MDTGRGQRRQAAGRQQVWACRRAGEGRRGGDHRELESRERPLPCRTLGHQVVLLLGRERQPAPRVLALSGPLSPSLLFPSISPFGGVRV